MVALYRHFLCRLRLASSVFYSVGVTALSWPKRPTKCREGVPASPCILKKPTTELFLVCFQRDTKDKIPNLGYPSFEKECPCTSQEVHVKPLEALIR